MLEIILAGIFDSGGAALVFALVATAASCRVAVFWAPTLSGFCCRDHNGCSRNLHPLYKYAKRTAGNITLSQNYGLNLRGMMMNKLVKLKLAPESSSGLLAKGIAARFIAWWYAALNRMSLTTMAVRRCT